jgi:DNA repair protein RadC
MKKIIKEIKVSEVDLIYKSRVNISQRPVIKSSTDAYRIFMENWDLDKIGLVEQFKVLYVNRANIVLGLYLISTGGITGTMADPRIIFSAALKINACAMILGHNHPSGNLKPSGSDIELTMRLKKAGSYFEIKVLDHLIVHPSGYYSLADEGEI